MKKNRYAAAFLVFVLLLSLTACGTNNSQSPTTSGAGMSSSPAAGSSVESGTSTDRTQPSGTQGETREGVIDGLVNDMQNGMDNLQNDMKGTRESGETSQNTTGNPASSETSVTNP